MKFKLTKEGEKGLFLGGESMVWIKKLKADGDSEAMLEDEFPIFM